jgi:hypothetical protein
MGRHDSASRESDALFTGCCGLKAVNGRKIANSRFERCLLWKSDLPCSRQLTLKFRMARDRSERAIWAMPLFTVRFGRS